MRGSYDVDTISNDPDSFIISENKAHTIYTTELVLWWILDNNSIDVWGWLIMDQPGENATLTVAYIYSN